MHAHPRAAVPRGQGRGPLGVDLVALRGDASFPIEVKSASKDVIRFADAGTRNQEQAERMRREGPRAGVIPLDAFRLKGGPGATRGASSPSRRGTSPMLALAKRIPKIAKTPAGNDALRWRDGMPLPEFIALLEER